MISENTVDAQPHTQSQSQALISLQLTKTFRFRFPQYHIGITRIEMGNRHLQRHKCRQI